MESTSAAGAITRRSALMFGFQAVKELNKENSVGPTNVPHLPFEPEALQKSRFFLEFFKELNSLRLWNPRCFDKAGKSIDYILFMREQLFSGEAPPRKQHFNILEEESNRAIEQITKFLETSMQQNHTELLLRLCQFSSQLNIYKYDINDFLWKTLHQQVLMDCQKSQDQVQKQSSTSQLATETIDQLTNEKKKLLPQVAVCPVKAR
jgi:hypothetical protein